MSSRSSLDREPATLVRALARDAGALSFAAPVTCVYNPLVYARASTEQYLESYARPGTRVLLLGMNPGPFGMVQTGVPFGDVAMVRDWLGIEARIERPESEHPARPIQGFACARSEVSGARLWGWARDRFDSPAAFFRRFFVWNWCPLAFLEETGRNRTPDKLSPTERAALYPICDRALASFVHWMQPELVIGVGTFAADRARAALGADGPRIGSILHPSPASPLANRGWAEQAEAQLRALGVSA